MKLRLAILTFCIAFAQPHFAPTYALAEEGSCPDPTPPKEKCAYGEKAVPIFHPNHGECIVDWQCKKIRDQGGRGEEIFD